MDNQQEIWSQSEIGWLAGILDGDGSIAMNVRPKNTNSKIGVDLKVAITNSDGNIVKRVTDLYDKAGYTYHISDSTKTRKGNTLVHVVLGRMNHILNFLSTITPHLAGEKSGRAQLMSKFIKRRIERNTHRSKHGFVDYDLNDWYCVKRFYEFMGKSIPQQLKDILRDYTCSDFDPVPLRDVG